MFYLQPGWLKQNWDVVIIFPSANIFFIKVIIVWIIVIFKNHENTTTFQFMRDIKYTPI